MECEAPEMAATMQPNSAVSAAERVGHVLVLESTAAGDSERLIVLDQTTTHICITQSGSTPARIAIHRSVLGWKLEAGGANCLLNGGLVDESWLSVGDCLAVANMEFHVRPITKEELIEQLPRFEGTDQGREAPQPESAVADTAIVDELQRLRIRSTEFEIDRQRLQASLNALREERIAAEREREAFATRRGTRAIPRVLPPAVQPTSDDATTLQAASSAETVVLSLSQMIAAELAASGAARASEYDNEACEPCGATARVVVSKIGPQRQAVRQNPEEIRNRLSHLRSVANQSARGALKRHFWKHHRSEVLLKVVLVGMSFALAAVLYFNHGAMGSSLSAMAWGCSAIGLITLSGLVHTWTEVNRLNGGARQAAATDSSTDDDCGAPELCDRASDTICESAAQTIDSCGSV